MKQKTYITELTPSHGRVESKVYTPAKFYNALSAAMNDARKAVKTRQAMYAVVMDEHGEVVASVY